jgi:hypothetical protein
MSGRYTNIISHILNWFPQALLNLMSDQMKLKLGNASEGPFGPSKHEQALTPSSSGPSF